MRRGSRVALAAAVAAALSMTGCMSPEDVRRYEISDTDDGDEEHLPGRPCLVCHREGYSPGSTLR